MASGAGSLGRFSLGIAGVDSGVGCDCAGRSCCRAGHPCHRGSRILGERDISCLVATAHDGIGVVRRQSVVCSAIFLPVECDLVSLSRPDT